MADELMLWREDLLARLDAICSSAGRVPHYVAEEIVAGCAWWESHPSGPVRAPKHANRIEGSETSWRLEFGANTFQVARAIHGCCQRIRQWTSQQREMPVSAQAWKSLNNELQGIVRGSVTNYRGDRFSRYGHNSGSKLIFGAQAICANDFVKGIAKYLRSPGLGTYQPGQIALKNILGTRRPSHTSPKTDQTVCPKCGCTLSQARLETHLLERCPERQKTKIRAAKNKQPVKKPSISCAISQAGPGLTTCPSCKGAVKSKSLEYHMTHICPNRKKPSDKARADSKKDATSEGNGLTVCPWCGAKVNKSRLAKHQAKRCPRRPTSGIRTTKSN